jgi:hypothetical protein
VERVEAVAPFARADIPYLPAGEVMRELQRWRRCGGGDPRFHGRITNPGTQEATKIEPPKREINAVQTTTFICWLLAAYL